MDQRIPGAETPVGTTRASELGDEPVRSRSEQVKQKAREVGQQATERIESAASERIDQATGEIGALASALREAGGRLSGESMMSGKLIRGAADKLEELSSRLDNRDLNDMVGEVRRWARRNPGAFVGAAVAVGFLASRFVKASEVSDGYDFDSFESDGEFRRGSMDTELYRGSVGNQTGDTMSTYGAGSTGGTSYGATGDFGSGAGYGSGMGSGSAGSGSGSTGSGFDSTGSTDRGFTGTSGGSSTGTTSGDLNRDTNRDGGRNGRS